MNTYTFNNEKYINLTPVLTSNSGPSPYSVESSSQFSSSYAAFKTFDGGTSSASSSTYWASAFGDTVPNAWIKINFGEVRTFDHMLFTKEIYSSDWGQQINSATLVDADGNTIDITIPFTVNNTAQDVLVKLPRPITTTSLKIIAKSLLHSVTNYVSLGKVRFLRSYYFCLLQDNADNKIYNYDSNSNSLIELPDSSLLTDDPESCIDGVVNLNNVFSLLSTLSNDLTLLCNKNVSLNIKGIKNSSMIATIEPISMKKYATINSITANYLTNGSGSIKFIFSFDKGTTWKTYDISTSTWNDVSVNIALKNYDNFSDAEKADWNDARDAILSDGIVAGNLDNVDFKSEVNGTLMFAVAFSRPSYADTSILNKLNINYDGVAVYDQLAVGSDLSKYEAKVSITGDTIGVTTAKDVDKLLVAMTTNI